MDRSESGDSNITRRVCVYEREHYINNHHFTSRYKGDNYNAIRRKWLPFQSIIKDSSSDCVTYGAHYLPIDTTSYLKEIRECLSNWSNLDVFVSGSTREGTQMARIFRYNKYPKKQYPSAELEGKLQGEMEQLSETKRQDSQKIEITEIDVMVSLLNQDLSNEKCIITTDRPGFVQVKLPSNSWVDGFQVGNNFITSPGAQGFVSAESCRKWMSETFKTASINGVFTNLCREMDMQNMVKLADVSLSKSGPATTIHSAIVAVNKFVVENYGKALHTMFDQLKLDEYVEIFANIQSMCNTLLKELDRNITSITGHGSYVSFDRTYTLLKMETNHEVFGIADIKNNLAKIEPQLEALSKLLNTPLVPNVRIQKKHSIPEIYNNVTKANTVANVLKFTLDLWKEIFDIENYNKFLTLGALKPKLHMKDFASNYEEAISTLFPCESQTDVDMVFSIHCMFWPSVAHEWLTRHRKSGYPSEELCQQIAQGGVHLVPKSYEGGSENLDWRWSFSSAEIQLADTQSKGQKVTYFIMKSIYYENLSDEINDEKLASYHLKTIMLWACEKYEMKTWDLAHLVPCVEGLLDDLIVALETKHLCHYFIPSINLLEDLSAEFLANRAVIARNIRQNLHLYPSEQNIETMSQREQIMDDMKSSMSNGSYFGVYMISCAVSMPYELLIGLVELLYPTFAQFIKFTSNVYSELNLFKLLLDRDRKFNEMYENGFLPTPDPKYPKSIMGMSQLDILFLIWNMLKRMVIKTVMIEQKYIPNIQSVTYDIETLVSQPKKYFIVSKLLPVLKNVEIDGFKQYSEEIGEAWNDLEMILKLWYLQILMETFLGKSSNIYLNVISMKMCNYVKTNLIQNLESFKVATQYHKTLTIVRQLNKAFEECSMETVPQFEPCSLGKINTICQKAFQEEAYHKSTIFGILQELEKLISYDITEESVLFMALINTGNITSSNYCEDYVTKWRKCSEGHNSKATESSSQDFLSEIELD